MKYSIVLLIVPVLQVLSCDHTKHYTNDKGECCDMCGPGTRMSSMATCKDPTCIPCKDGEYQDGYTKEAKCSLQPYCDPNVHKESTQPITKEHRSECQCMSGYHCASEYSCTTCTKNTICTPGQKVKKEGNHMTDTVCEECPDGSFSSQESAVSCQPWTECSSSTVKQKGNTTSDRLCADPETPNHLGLSIALPLAIIAMLLGICFGLYKAGKCDTFLKTHKQLKNIMHAPVQEIQPLKNEVDVEAAREDQRLGPEENEVKDDETRAPVPVEESGSAADAEVLSEGGQVIQQEQGKEDVMSQTESCPSPQTSVPSSTCY